MGLARAMFKHATKVEGLDDVVDIVGTGGDGANNTVNISTGASVLAVACSGRVAKVCVCKRYLLCAYELKFEMVVMMVYETPTRTRTREHS